MTQYIIHTKAGHRHHTADLSTADSVGLEYAFQRARDPLYTDEPVTVPLYVIPNATDKRTEILTIRANHIESLTEVSREPNSTKNLDKDTFSIGGKVYRRNRD